MIAPGVLKVKVVERPDGGCELVGDAFYCLAMFARSQLHPRPSLEAVLERALYAAMAVPPPLAEARDTAQLPLFEVA